MSNPPLPPEILDYIVDLLHDDSNPLKECCLVSKCWIPRTRKHLFAHIKLKTAADLESWKETFPDPSTSPAHHTNTLSVGCPHLITPADADGWIRGFSRVVKLELVTSSRTTDESMISFIPLHGFSPVIESLHVRFGFVPPSRIFSLILSFPLLGDLTLVSCCTPTNSSNGPDGLPTVVQPSNSPAFTGSLDLYLEGGTMLIARRLLALPGGLRFQKFTSTWCDEEGLLLTTAVVEECSYTLEFLDIICYLLVGAELPPIDLSKATMLKNVAFWTSGIEWIIMALRTITPNHRELRQVSIYVAEYSTFVNICGEGEQIAGKQTPKEWQELDHLLAQLWESHSIRPKITYNRNPGHEEVVTSSVGYLLPEITGKGIIDLVKI